MNKLPEDFEFHKYGLDVRLVRDSDAEFILKLRTDPEKSMFIHQTDSDIKKHLDWFAEYKKREAEGRDYYFLYSKHGRPVGVNRIYNIYNYYGTPGSWICSTENDLDTIMATSFCGKEIMFNVIGLDLLIFDVRKGNKHVQRMHKIMGARLIGESELDFYYSLSKEDYYQHLSHIINSFNFD